MTIDRFKALLETYGADPARWPAGERDDALRLLSASEEARTARDEAAALDALISRARLEPAPSDMLAARILRSVPQPEFFGDWRRVAAAAALALFVGLGGGYFGGSVVPADDDTLLYEMAFDGLDSDLGFDWEGGA